MFRMRMNFGVQLRVAGLAAVMIPFQFLSLEPCVADESAESISLVPNSRAATDVKFDLQVAGKLITPSSEGPRKHALTVWLRGYSS